MKDSVAIVTGASQGIGRSTAIRLSRRNLDNIGDRSTRRYLRIFKSVETGLHRSRATMLRRCDLWADI
jgi:NAD(P)-dependent dehydrogenase (short-subunit alcohol dehydrogenase family)